MQSEVTASGVAILMFSLDERKEMDAWQCAVNATALRDALADLVNGLGGAAALEAADRHGVADLVRERLAVPAVFAGWQERVTGEPIALWSLTRDVANRAKGSTVSTETLRGLGVHVKEPRR